MTARCRFVVLIAFVCACRPQMEPLDPQEELPSIAVLPMVNMSEDPEESITWPTGSPRR